MQEVALTRPLTTEIGAQWFSAFDGLSLRHPDPTCSVGFELTDRSDGVHLFVWATVRDSRDAAVWRHRQAIHTSRITFWPGLAAARAWLAIGWTSYMVHESLECVRHGGAPVLDPHDGTDPPADMLFRRAMPSVLTPETLRHALLAMLPPPAVDRLIDPL